MLIAVYVYLCIQLIYVAYYDLKTKKISNRWMIGNVGFYFLFLLFFPEHYSFTWLSFAWPIGFFVAGFILFIFKIMGGGDSKYLSSFYLLIPYHLHEEAFSALLVATLFIGGSVFMKNILENLDRLIVAFRTSNLSLIKGVFGKKFTFAPVIFVSWLWFGWTNREKLVWY